MIAFIDMPAPDSELLGPDPEPLGSERFERLMSLLTANEEKGAT